MTATAAVKAPGGEAMLGLAVAPEPPPCYRHVGSIITLMRIGCGPEAAEMRSLMVAETTGLPQQAAGVGWSPNRRHCEERSDEAIQRT